MASYVVECVCGCGSFEAGSPRAKWRTPGCKKRAQRTAAGTAEGEPTSGRKLDPLEVAVRKELKDLSAEESVDGQIAIHLAKQVKAATGSSAASLAKELRTVLDRIAGPSVPAGTAPVVEDDEVTKARRRREEIEAAAAAAGE